MWEKELAGGRIRGRISGAMWKEEYTGKANREVSGQSEMAVFFWRYIVKLFHDMPG